MVYFKYYLDGICGDLDMDLDTAHLDDLDMAKFKYFLKILNVNTRELKFKTVGLHLKSEQKSVTHALRNSSLFCNS